MNSDATDEISCDVAIDMPTYTINGHTVKVEDDAENGFKYLKYDLSPDESEVFFHEAKRMGQAKFEDDHDRDYTLVHNSDATYSITRRQSL